MEKKIIAKIMLNLPLSNYEYAYYMLFMKK